MNVANHWSGMGGRRLRAWWRAVALTVALGSAGCAGVAVKSHPGTDEPGLQQFQIRAVQRELELRGYRGVETTGRLDEPTRSALAVFQASKGIPGNGQLDSATAEALGMSLDPRYNCEMNNTVDCYPGSY